jgi:YD repeat-containing protein
MQAFALTLASLRPEVKSFLVEKGALAPTLQAVFRRSNKSVATDEDYFMGLAHPVVFRGDNVDADRMVTLAHELTIETLPPVALLQVEEEDKEFAAGRDYFDPVPNEQIFDTPAAIARVMRAAARERRMIVSAAGSRELGDRPLTFRWSLLQGRPELVTIRPLDEQQSRVEITVAWHDRFPVAPDAELESNRVDIGCFASAGSTWSAPAFVCFYCPDNEERLYDEQGRIESIRYNDHYADPVIVNRKNWRDEYHYDALGTLTGWTRRRGISTWEFTAEGLRVVAQDAEGKPTKTTAVQYTGVTSNPNTAPVLQQSDVGGE